MKPKAAAAVALFIVTGLIIWVAQQDPAERSPELPGTMTKIASAGGAHVWHLEYKDRHYLVSSRGGIMILPRWVEGSAKVAPPLERLDSRRHGPEPDTDSGVRYDKDLEAWRY